MHIRRYRPSDCEYLAELFYETVHTVNANDYTDQQLEAWADGSVDLKEWNRTFQEHVSVVAVMDDRIVGFGDMDAKGYLDRLYVHKDYQKKGIATAICQELEGAAEVDKITVHASITAKPFFLSRGYKIVKEQQVYRKGISLTNYLMEKGMR